MANRFEWGYRAWPILTSTARRHQTLTYGEVADRLGMGGSTPVRIALWPLQDLCLEKGWPPLTSIVLNKRTRRPGPGFIAWDGDLDEAHREVFAFDWHNKPRPFSKDFRKKWERVHEGTGSGNGSGNDPDDFSVPDQMVSVNGRGAFQRQFRDLLMRAYSGRCALCDTRLKEMLVASHITPWSSDRNNRLNPRNGILLCRTHDCLFDTGVIKISPQGDVSWPGISRSDLGRDLYRLVTKRTLALLRMPMARFRPDPTFLQWRLDNPGTASPE